MAANAALFEVAKLIRQDEALSYEVIVTPSAQLMASLRANPAPAATTAVAAIDGYLSIYGHMGYSMDFVEPPQIEDPSGLLTTLKNMVGQADCKFTSNLPFLWFMGPF